jgi:hypothetical protein
MVMSQSMRLYSSTFRAFWGASALLNRSQAQVVAARCKDIALSWHPPARAGPRLVKQPEGNLAVASKLDVSAAATKVGCSVQRAARDGMRIWRCRFAAA